MDINRRSYRLLGIAAIGFLPTFALAFDESDIGSLHKWDTTFDEVVAKFGEPQRMEFSDDGLRTAGYFDSSAQMNAASAASLIGSVASIFLPGAAALTTSTASSVVGAVGGGASGKSSAVAMTFDKNGRLLYWRAILGDMRVGTFSSGSSQKTASSEDGAGPMPNFTVPPMPVPAAAPSDGKPRLGITYATLPMLAAETQEKFAAARFRGVIVTTVSPGSAAEKAGIRPSDYLYVLNGAFVDSADEIAKAMQPVRTGDAIKAHVKRIDQNARLVKEEVVTLRF